MPNDDDVIFQDLSVRFQFHGFVVDRSDDPEPVDPTEAPESPVELQPILMPGSGGQPISWRPLGPVK